MSARASLGSGRYEILFRLGRGGMAEVFAGRLRGEGDFTKLVAIKRMLPHLASDPALVRRFLDEAKLAAHVHSAHVVSTLDVGRDDDGSPFLVLELVVGVTLARLIEAGHATLAERAHLVAEVALGLAEVHEARGPDGAPLSMVHRDVSPANVLVGTDGRARLADFGIARADLPREATAVGTRLGKPGYMAPEALLGGPADARSDVWSLGVVLWEALAGRRLFPGGEADASREAPPLRWSTPVCPEALARLTERALARDPADRFRDARELSSALVTALAELPASDPAAIARHVRAAGEPGLSSLEAALRTDAAEPSVTLELEDVTVSGLIGDAWDPNAPTRRLDPPTLTRVDATATPARATPWRSIAIAAVGLAGLGVGLAVAIALTRPEPSTPHVALPPVEPATRGSSPAPTAPAPVEAVDDPIEAPPARAADASSDAAPRPVRAATPRPAPAPTPSTGGRAGTVGLDVFDRGGR
ncbi:MAG: protein kinase [Sandaracinaceae bacterium]|nr:protein kinase [Sandaracinaceae bacterium]